MSVDPAAIRLRIRDLASSLDGLGPLPADTPQFGISANAVRQNEYLSKKDAIQSDLIRSYALYATSLEETSAGLVDIQHQMIQLLRMQAEDIQR